MGTSLRCSGRCPRKNGRRARVADWILKARCVNGAWRLPRPSLDISPRHGEVSPSRPELSPHIQTVTSVCADSPCAEKPPQGPRWDMNGLALVQFLLWAMPEPCT